MHTNLAQCKQSWLDGQDGKLPEPRGERWMDATAAGTYPAAHKYVDMEGTVGMPGTYLIISVYCTAAPANRSPGNRPSSVFPESHLPQQSGVHLEPLDWVVSRRTHKLGRWQTKLCPRPIHFVPSPTTISSDNQGPSQWQFAKIWNSWFLLGNKHLLRGIPLQSAEESGATGVAAAAAATSVAAFAID